jgi:carboxypeptidase family protein/TonB-dependent receptor-like protein
VSYRKIFCKYVRSFIAAAALLLALFVSTPVGAQVAGGSLSGTITDPSGAGIPLAQVAIKNVATGVERILATNTDGFYTAPNLLPGEYQITISAKGFNTEIKHGITINVGARQVFDLALQIGTVTHRVEVTAEAPAIQLASSDISATVNATTVRELPLNGRSWTDLAALQPGVDTIQTQPTFAVGADRGNRGFGQQLTISGARPQQNNYRLDGVSLNDYANGSPGSVLGGNLGVDAIQEFSVLTSNYSAEYGKTSGGVVNATTRSGTNSFHGSGYEFLRNSSLDAANFFERGKRTPFKRNQFGGAIGGPIVKNRTFFFADYEGIRQSKGIADVSFVPSPTARQGILHCTSADVTNNVPGCTSTSSTHTVTVDPAVQKYLGTNTTPGLYPMTPDCGADACQFTFSAKQIVNENFVTTRIDHKFSDKDSLFGTYLFDRTPYSSPDSFGNVGLGSLTSRQIVAAEETHSFTSTFINAARFGYNHEAVNNNQSLTAINKLAADPSLGAFAGRDAAYVKVGGLNDLSGGVGGLPTYFYHWNSFQAYDDAFLNRGTHTIKFGFAFERMLLQATALTDPNGIWTFKNLTAFLQNQPKKFQGGVASSLTPRNFRQNIFGGYVQDDWRAKPNLTLNLGLRYEVATVPTETDDKLVNLKNIGDPLPVCGKLVTAANGTPFCSGTGPLYSNPTLKNFEPRIGFAWDPFRNGKIAVRGGAGLFDVLPLPYQFILLETQAIPFFQYTTLNVGDTSLAVPLTFPLVPPADITGNKLRTTFIDSHQKRNYVAQWNLNIQYQLTPSLAAMVAYVGSRGVHQPFRVDEADLIIPTKKPPFGYLWPQVDVLGNIYVPGVCNQTDPTLTDPAQCVGPKTVNPAFGTVRGMFYQGRSYFNALELQLAKRMSHGFQVQGTYTWSKSIDTSSATLAGDAFGNSIASLHWFDMKLTRGLSDFNVGRTLVVNGTWDVPTAKSFSGPARWITDGWELGLILTVSDGVPFAATWGSGSDPANTLSSDDWNFPNRLGGPDCRSLTNPGNPNNYIKTQCFAIPTAPNAGFWAANCDPAPPSVGGPIDPASLQCFNLRGNSGRNIMIGPGITSLDFSVFKNNHIKRISENFNVQFRVEMFNILNHANFALPETATDGNTDIFDGTGASLAPTVVQGGTAGVLLRTTVPERQIQFAIKIIF